MNWSLFENGNTIGQRTAEGVIIKDEEHSSGARITLERGPLDIPYIITLGIYYLFFHTHYCKSQEQAEEDFQILKDKLSEILSLKEANPIKQSDMVQALIDFSDERMRKS